MKRFFFYYCFFFLFLLGCDSVDKKKNSNKIDDFHSYNIKAKNAYDRKQYQESIFYYQKIINKFKKNKEYKKEVAWSQYEIGFCYLVMKNYLKAKENFKKVLNNHSVLSSSILSKQRLEEIENLVEKKMIKN